MNATLLDGIFIDKAGREISFVYTEDAEKPNRGIVEDRLEAFHDGAKVGYIRCEYVTKESLETYLPTPYNFMACFEGSLIIPFDDRHADLRKASPQALSVVAERMVRYNLARQVPSAPVRNYREFQRWVSEHGNRYRLADTNRAYKQFKNRINNPFVSYVCLAANSSKGVAHDSRRLGIGTELYRRMALELDSRGMELRSSTLRSNDAIGIWDSFIDKGWAKRSGKRYKLDADLLKYEAQGPRP